MMSTRLVSFILMSMMLHVRDSSAQTKALGKVLVTDKRERPTAGRSRINVEEEEIYGGVPAAAEVGTRLGGRKMMIKKAVGLVKEEGLKGDDLKIKGAAHSVRSCKYRGNGIQNIVNCKLRIRVPRRPMDDVKMAGFVAFNADYNVPKPHPPQNN